MNQPLVDSQINKEFTFNPYIAQTNAIRSRGVILISLNIKCKYLSSI